MNPIAEFRDNISWYHNIYRDVLYLFLKDRRKHPHKDLFPEEDYKAVARKVAELDKKVKPKKIKASKPDNFMEYMEKLAAYENVLERKQGLSDSELEDIAELRDFALADKENLEKAGSLFDRINKILRKHFRNEMEIYFEKDLTHDEEKKYSHLSCMLKKTNEQKSYNDIKLKAYELSN